MPDETLIAEIENILSEIVRLGGENERSQVVPNLTVQNASPTNLDGFVIVSDDRDGDNILAKKVPSMIYADNDFVNVIFPRGGEAIAFQQGSQSANSGMWEIVPSTSTDIFYDKGNVGVGATTPAATIEAVDSSGEQLRLTHTEPSKSTKFTVDTNHNLTITPSSTGQIILQPTTDSTDFFQVLDANGGTPIFNVDSANERVGVGISAPGYQFNIRGSTLPASNTEVFKLEDSSGQNRSTIRNTGAQEWLLHSTAAEAGRITYSTPGGKPAILLFTGSPGSYVNRFDIAHGATTFNFKFNADSFGLLIESGGNVGIGTANPEGRFHSYDSISGFLLWEYDGLDATVRTIISNGTGDVLYRLHAAYVLRDSAAAVSSGTTDVSNGASVNLTVGTNTVRLRVNADGSTDIARTAGTDTIKVALTLRWL